MYVDVISYILAPDYSQLYATFPLYFGYTIHLCRIARKVVFQHNLLSNMRLCIYSLGYILLLIFHLIVNVRI